MTPASPFARLTLCAALLASPLLACGKPAAGPDVASVADAAPAPATDTTPAAAPDTTPAPDAAAAPPDTTPAADTAPPAAADTMPSAAPADTSTAAADTAPAPVAPTGATKVQILSATTKNKVVEGAQVILQKDGMASVQGVTDATGRVSVPHAFGADDDNVKLIVKKDGFSSLVVNCPCDGLTYAISETNLQLDSFRVVLNWGTAPLDLDLHARYGESHILFSSKTGRDGFLDVDDTDGLGPETITIKKRHDGEKYIFAVHNYSAGGQHLTRDLSRSDAKVFVYVGQTLLRSYYIPKAQVGELWVVFSIDGDGAIRDLDNVVDIAESEAVGPYLGQLARRADMGLPQRTSQANVVRATEYNRRGEVELAAGRLEPALDLFQRAVEVHRNFGLGYENLATTFEKLGRTAEASWAKKKAAELANLPPAVGFRVPNERATLTASSKLDDWKHYTFGGENLIDDNLWTSWQPKRKPAGGVGEWIKMQFNTPQTLTGFEFSNGFRRLDELGDLYVMNNRIKDALVEFSDGTSMPITFEDVAGEKTFTLPEPKRTDWVKVTVKSIYKGTRWNDLAVSEFHALSKDE
jgi:uncharacterized protein YfaP (DUF2135 family)